MTWTVRRVSVRCGAESGCVVLAGEPLALLNEGRNLRCTRHAGAAVDDQAVEAARQAIAAEDAERAARAEAPPVSGRRSARVAPRLPLRSADLFAEIPDPKRAAAGDRE